MPRDTFFALPDAKRQRVVEEAIVEFSEKSFDEASLTDMVRRLGIAKGSIYQYFESKLDLYRWLIVDEVPRRKQAFASESEAMQRREFWQRLEWRIERGMAFLVEHPRLARLSASSASPSASPEIRGLHNAICEQSYVDLRRLLAEGIKSGALPPKTDLMLATSVASSVIGPGLIDVILRTLKAELHEVLEDDGLRNRLDSRLRRKLAKQSVAFLRDGLGARSTARPRKGTS